MKWHNHCLISPVLKISHLWWSFCSWLCALKMFPKVFVVHAQLLWFHNKTMPANKSSFNSSYSVVLTDIGIWCQHSTYTSVTHDITCSVLTWNDSVSVPCLKLKVRYSVCFLCVQQIYCLCIYQITSFESQSHFGGGKDTFSRVKRSNYFVLHLSLCHVR